MRILFRVLWVLVDAALWAIGIAGIPQDLQIWTGWVGQVMNATTDPFIQWVSLYLGFGVVSWRHRVRRIDTGHSF